MNGNDFVKSMLKSPLQVFMGKTMLITVTGRKTGRKIAVPVNYYRDANELWVMTTRSRYWWRNVKDGAEVDLHVCGKERKGFAKAILDEFSGGRGRRGLHTASADLCWCAGCVHRE